MKRQILILIGLLLWGASASAAPTAKEILARADTFRGFGKRGFSVYITIVSYRPDKKPKRNRLRVRVKSTKSLVQFLAPKRVQGRAMLFEGRNLWFHFPGTRRVVRISPAQRLMGESSNGDVASTNFSGDYTPTLVGEESIGEIPCYHLKLKAIDPKVTYASIEYWVARKTGRPVKSEHHAISGKLLKIAFYNSFVKVNGKEKVAKLLLVNPLFKGRYTWMIYSGYKRKQFPDALFRKENLNRL